MGSGSVFPQYFAARTKSWAMKFKHGLLFYHKYLTCYSSAVTVRHFDAKKDYGFDRGRSRYEITVTSILISNSVAIDGNTA